MSIPPEVPSQPDTQPAKPLPPPVHQAKKVVPSKRDWWERLSPLGRTAVGIATVLGTLVALVGLYFTYLTVPTDRLPFSSSSTPIVAPGSGSSSQPSSVSQSLPATAVSAGTVSISAATQVPTPTVAQSSPPTATPSQPTAQPTANQRLTATPASSAAPTVATIPVSIMRNVATDIPGTPLKLGDKVSSVVDGQTRTNDVYALTLAAGQRVQAIVSSKPLRHLATCGQAWHPLHRCTRSGRDLPGNYLYWHLHCCCPRCLPLHSWLHPFTRRIHPPDHSCIDIQACRTRRVGRHTLAEFTWLG